MLPLSDLIQKLIPAQGYDHDEAILSFHRLGYILEEHIGFHNTKPATGTPGSSLMYVLYYQESRWMIPTNDYEFRTIIKIPAENFKRLVIKLNNFADDDLVPWLMDTLKSDNSNVERSGAAQGLSEVLAALGTEYFEHVLPVIRNCSHQKAFVRDGHLTLFKYLPRSLGIQFQNYLQKVLPAIIDGQYTS